METIRERRMRKKREMQEAYIRKHGNSIKSGNAPSYAQFLNMHKAPMSRQSRTQLEGLDSATSKDISKFFK